MNKPTITSATEEILAEFDEQFGKAGPDGDSDSIKRSAGCDDCAWNIREREEHRDFIAAQFRIHTENLLEELREKVHENERNQRLEQAIKEIKE